MPEGISNYKSATFLNVVRSRHSLHSRARCDLSRPRDDPGSALLPPSTVQRCSHFGGRLAMKAFRPSMASAVLMVRSTYIRSTSARRRLTSGR